MNQPWLTRIYSFNKNRRKNRLILPLEKADLKPKSADCMEKSACGYGPLQRTRPEGLVGMVSASSGVKALTHLPHFKSTDCNSRLIPADYHEIGGTIGRL